MATKPVLIIQQAWHDTPDYFLDFLNREGIAIELRRMDRGEPVPLRAVDYAGICLLGGPMSANDGATLPWLDQQIQLARDAVQTNVPVIGHCLGGQLLAKALGASVQASPQPEIGWSEIAVRSHPDSARWFGASKILPLFQWHGESFAIPAGANWLAETAACPHQAYVIDGIHFGMQFHCEIKAEKLRLWLEHHHDEIDACAAVSSVQQGEAILAELDAKLTASQRVAERIYHAWIQALA
ncbi:type 1 glutamine amidotransferase [Permianibacter sp. IMCC34836]|uniref:type 1 glutamine amidotransferase n=1 Tax=Permianibacter fluminis TaxID=2738515 RepID=UPI0015553572|nr:type 1 glutamine amidotransferase [Permianibacter fluminis]NQD38871.1 type 1 glutamine amidotransferase [Permianibacter fluminis]